MNDNILNYNEIRVLMACTDDRAEYSPDEYHGFMTDQVHVKGLTKNQINGYLSQLQQKKCICLYTKDDACYFSANITNRGLAVIASNI